MAQPLSSFIFRIPVMSICIMIYFLPCVTNYILFHSYMNVQLVCSYIFISSRPHHVHIMNNSQAN